MEGAQEPINPLGNNNQDQIVLSTDGPIADAGNLPNNGSYQNPNISNNDNNNNNNINNNNVNNDKIGSKQVKIEALRVTPSRCCGTMSYSYLTSMPFELNNISGIDSNKFTQDITTINNSLASGFQTVKIVRSLGALLVITGFITFGASGISAVSSGETGFPVGVLIGALLFICGGGMLVFGGFIQSNAMEKQIFILENHCSRLTNEYNSNGINIRWKCVVGDSMTIINRYRDSDDRHGRRGGYRTVATTYVLYDIVIEY